MSTEGSRFHDLRHTANTMAAPGSSTRELMRRMGHAKPFTCGFIAGTRIEIPARDTTRIGWCGPRAPWGGCLGADPSDPRVRLPGVWAGPDHPGARVPARRADPGGRPGRLVRGRAAGQPAGGRRALVAAERPDRVDRRCHRGPGHLDPPGAGAGPALRW